MRRVTVLGLGGTIAMAGAGPNGVVPDLSPAQLLAGLPGLAGSGVDVSTEEVARVPGASVGFAELSALAGRIGHWLAPGPGRDAADGVVVTQGTDTIEETAYLLDLHHRHPAPVVVTGAMRNPTLAGADGPANLLAAIQVAASPRARDLGVLVAFADEIHAACRVRKTHATSVAAFRSPAGGPLGYVVEGVPRLFNRPLERFLAPTPAAVSADDRPARVGLLTVGLGDDGSLLPALAGRVDGLVVAALGAGHVPAAMVEALGDLADRLPVVLASRTGAGPVLAHTYGFAGSERDLRDRGLVSAGFLHPFKARLLLRTLLSGGLDRAAIGAAFAAAGGEMFGEP